MYRPHIKGANWQTKNKEELRLIRATLVKNSLRQATFFWPPRTTAIQRATTRRGYRKCAECKHEHHHKDCELDHKLPVEPTDASQNVDNPDWNVYIERLFAFTGWRVVCKRCHLKKTEVENAIRNKNRERKDE